MTKESYERTKIEIFEFDAEDVIATSGGDEIPESVHYDDYEGNGYIFG